MNSRTALRTLILALTLCALVGAVAMVHGVVRSMHLQGNDFHVNAGAVSSSGPLANCRYGVATLGDAQVDWVDDFGAGWYLNFGRQAPPAPNAAEYVPLIRVKQNKTPDGTYLPTFEITPPLTDSGLGLLLSSRPGAIWIVGNEVDRGPDPGQTQGGQGDTFPDVYAEAYHDVYRFIKERDAAARVAISGLVQVTPGRMQYLDLVWDAYFDKYGSAMPVDIWNMHLYVLPEAEPNGQPNGVANIALGTDPALAKRWSGGDPAQCPLDEIYCYAEHDDMDRFAEQVLAMRTWMRDHGQRHKPLILSEFSLLYPYIVDPGGTCFLQDEFGQCFTPPRVTAFTNAVLPYLESAVDPVLGYPLDGNRLVQQWLWFSISNDGGVGDVSDLVNPSLTALTMVGQAFKNHSTAQVPAINLFPAEASHTTAFSGVGATADAPIWISVRNNGNAAPIASFSVTFYEDPSLIQPIGSATVNPPGGTHPGMTGCATRDIVVSVNWLGLTPGLHRFWAKVDSGNSVDEGIYEGDNVGTGTVIVDPQQVILPLAVR